VGCIFWGLVMIDSTNMFTVKKIIYDDGEFAVSKGLWDGRSRRIGVRWYEEDGMGFPQTYGKPQWLVLPAKFTPFINKMYKEFKLNKRMNEFLESIK